MSFSPHEPAVEWPAGHSVRRRRAEFVRDQKSGPHVAGFVTVKKSKLLRMVNVPANTVKEACWFVDEHMCTKNKKN
jgi:hypothetical protein